jgi:sulfide dehydrogenase cytochrome subunit
MKKIFFLSFAVLVSYAGISSADNGRLLASQCFQCHGPNGHSKGEIDSIDGKSYSDLVGDLIEMKKKNKVEIMHLQIKSYTNEEIKQMAAYLSTSH